MEKHQKQAMGTLAVEDLRKVLLAKLSKEEKECEIKPEEGYIDDIEGLDEKGVVYLSELSKKLDGSVMGAYKKMTIIKYLMLPYLLFVVLLFAGVIFRNLQMVKLGFLCIPAFLYGKVLWLTKGGYQRALTVALLLGVPLWLFTAKFLNSVSSFLN